MLEAGFIGSRFLHFMAVLSLLGTAFFPLYTFRGRLQSFSADQPRLVNQIRWTLIASVLLAFLSAVSWFAFTAGAMAGDMSQVTDPEIMSAMMQATDFGPLWVARFAVLFLIALLLIRWPSRPAQWLLPLLAAVLLASLAGTGHARATQGLAGVLHMASDAAHLVAAGIWLGGLWPLGYMIAATRNARGDPNRQLAMGDVLTRFSGVGTITVAVLVASGLVNSWFLVGSPMALLSSPYGWLLSAKIALFLLMALLATANRFWLTPKISAFPTSQEWLARLRLHVFGEQALGLFVIGLVSVLGTLEPAISQSGAAQ